MSEHTKGPWIVTELNGYPSGIEAPGDAGIPGAVGCVVRARGIGLPSSDVGKANARLIASAPDLLAACEAFLGSLPADMSKWRMMGLDTTALTMARLKAVMAIQKAEGK